uniref:Retrotransposon gag domain-containing protein n=1 Tax=Cajanus cajan TaxID=3821 RepID=A0A151S526_CAJCA|nr:hypothetical protein KK1_028374 [Cajanus cajan]
MDARYDSINTILTTVVEKLATFQPSPSTIDVSPHPNPLPHSQPTPNGSVLHNHTPPANVNPFPTFSPNFFSTLNPPPLPHATRHPSSSITTTPIRPPKLQLFPFDGSEPLDWLFQADQFFAFHQIPPDHRLPMVDFYMKGDALTWFKWMVHNHQLTDWFSFERALEFRFGPTEFENFRAELFKLRPHTTVIEYQQRFEKISTRVFGLPPDALVDCFFSGLLPEIRRELAILKPTSISQAIGLAKLIEVFVKHEI